VISPLDDLPCHQSFEPVANPATTDPNYAERYYFSASCPDAGACLLVGLSQYPNRGLADAFALAAADGVQHVVRSSCELSDRADSRVGPIAVEVVEGLRRIRVVCDPNDGEIGFDLRWNGDAPPFEEPPVLATNSFGRVNERATRFVQTGTWEGSLRIAGIDHDVTPDRWRGARDRFWGIRRLPEPAPRRPSPHLAGLVVWAPIRFASSSLHLVQFAQPDGRRTRAFCRQVPHHGQPGPSRDLEFVRLSFDVQSSTQILDHAEFVLLDPSDRSEITIDITPRMAATLSLGTGYGGGGETDWLHGQYQGPLVVQSRRYELSSALRAGINTTIFECRSSDASMGSGTGLVDFTASGSFVEGAALLGGGLSRITAPVGARSEPT
jgi:hypothetical protein